MFPIPRYGCVFPRARRYPAATGKGWRAKMGVDILDGVGSTEMLHIFLSNREGDVAYGTSGVAVPGL